MQPNNHISAQSARILAFDYMKAIAIILVVIGHYCPEGSPKIWVAINKIIYSFHMPVFMAASGFLYAYTRKPQRYSLFLIKKFKRLIVPYLSASVLIFGIKIFTERIVAIENPVQLADIVRILWYPEAGYFLWFLMALWWCFVLIPLFRTKGSRLTLLIIAASLSVLPWHAPEVLCLCQTQKMLVYFVLGVVIHDYSGLLKRLISVNIWLVLSLFLLAEIIYVWEVPALVYILPYLGITAMLSLSFAIERTGRIPLLRHTLLFVSFYSFGIYLFHTTFEGFGKTAFAILYRHFDITWSVGPFAVAATVIILAGVIFPILLYRCIFSRFVTTQLLFGASAPAKNK